MSYGISSINYDVDHRYIRIRIGPLPIRKFPVEDIEDIRAEVRHGVESWTNTIHWATIKRKAVTVYRRTGLLKKVVITPDDPPKFIKLIKTHPFYSGTREE